MRKFIKDNNITFNEGERNSSIVTCIGYAQYLGITKDDLESELAVEIEEDGFLQEEINRLWDYCKSNNYKKYWKTKEAINEYTF